VIDPQGRKNSFHDLTEVTFRQLDDAAISDYFSLVNPLDKAGAYGIQEHGARIVLEIRGSFENVMGLPLEKVIEALGEIGLR
jgi:septum formation protein